LGKHGFYACFVSKKNDKKAGESFADGRQENQWQYHD